jgi:hypothetical protein
MEMSSSRKRSTRQIRKSLHETRKRLDHDLTDLQERVEDSVKPRNLLTRHPAVMTVAGAVIGFLVIKNPALIARGLTRIAQASTPFLVRAALSRGGDAVAQMTARSGEEA